MNVGTNLNIGMGSNVSVLGSDSVPVEELVKFLGIDEGCPQPSKQIEVGGLDNIHKTTLTGMCYTTQYLADEYGTESDRKAIKRLLNKVPQNEVNFVIMQEDMPSPEAEAPEAEAAEEAPAEEPSEEPSEEEASDEEASE
jgi:hypothetical protein